MIAELKQEAAAQITDMDSLRQVLAVRTGERDDLAMRVSELQAYAESKVPSPVKLLDSKLKIPEVDSTPSEELLVGQTSQSK